MLACVFAGEQREVIGFPEELPSALRRRGA
jgi:hypothetical protein